MSAHDERVMTAESVIEFIEEIIGIELESWQSGWIRGAIIYEYGEAEEAE